MDNYGRIISKSVNGREYAGNSREGRLESTDPIGIWQYFALFAVVDFLKTNPVQNIYIIRGSRPWDRSSYRFKNIVGKQLYFSHWCHQPCTNGLPTCYKIYPLVIILNILFRLFWRKHSNKFSWLCKLNSQYDLDYTLTTWVSIGNDKTLVT